ncbi:hypothetical protein DL769_005394 [Monosporascus sp. CRB-8-3]|nr:hypothetical protein DL769_005394 [Monosporascus sp. CRB-8-3]
MNRGAARYRSDLLAMDMGNRRDLFEERYWYSYINLSGIDQLQITVVRSFAPSRGTRHLTPSSLLALTARFPNLTGVGCAASNDPLCTALHDLFSKSNLQTLYYNGRIDPSFSWPYGLKEPDSHWTDHPLPPSTPDHIPPGYGTAEETEAALAFACSMQPETNEDGLGNRRQVFRRIPDDEVIIPML